MRRRLEVVVELSGFSFIAGRCGWYGGQRFAAHYAATGVAVKPLCNSPSAEELGAAASAAQQAFASIARSSARHRAASLRAIAAGLETRSAQLASLGTEADLANNQDLITILERKVGRLPFNGFPTGVEVSNGIVTAVFHQSSSNDHRQASNNYDGRDNGIHYRYSSTDHRGR